MHSIGGLESRGTTSPLSLWTLFLAIWEEKKVPQDLKNAIIVTIFKKHCHFDCGNYRFRGGRSTSDMMFALLVLLEKCREQHQELHAVLMWALLKKIGIPPKVVNII